MNNNNNVSKWLEIIMFVIMFAVAIDILGFIAWRTSGQRPQDSFHAGIMTESIISRFNK